MEKQEYYYILGALIGLGLANIITHKLVKENESSYEDAMKKTKAMTDKWFEEERERHIKEMERISEEGEEDRRKMKEMADEDFEKLRRRFG